MFTARYELTDALVTANKTDHNWNNAMKYVTNALLNLNYQCTVCVTAFKLLVKKQHTCQLEQSNLFDTAAVRQIALHVPTTAVLLHSIIYKYVVLHV